MGIHDRDYYRDGSRGMFDAWGRRGATVGLIAVTAAVFLAQVVSRDLAGAGEIADGPLTRATNYNPLRVMEGEVWRLLTPVFLHAGLLHLAFNMLVLYWAGSRLEEHYGGREFLLFYLCAGLFASTLRFAVQAAGLAPPSIALGASGAVTAVLVLYACHYPRQQILVMFVLPMPVWLVAVLYVALDVMGALGVGRGGVGYLAHLGGALFGLGYYKLGVRISNILPAARGRQPVRSAPKLRVVPSDPDEADEDEEPVGAAVDAPARSGGVADEQFEARVDQLLQKVSQTGQESLTAEERELLFRASEVYKKRRK
jgi:membrane associated rhomboid family serine protease